jgi:hypothetical protein
MSNVLYRAILDIWGTMERVGYMENSMVPLQDVSRTSPKQYDGAAHAIREFSAGVAFMVEEDSRKVDIGSLIENLVKALQGQAQKPAVHPIMYLNMAFVLGLAFACGSLWTRMSTEEARTSALEQKTQAVELIPVVNAKMDMFQQEVTHLRDIMDGEKKAR